VLEEEPVGHLGIISDDLPYVTPLSFVFTQHKIYFRTGPGRRVDAIGQDGTRVCFEVSRYSNDVGGWESVICWGTARLVESEGVEAEVIGMILVKYRDIFGKALSFSRPAPLAPKEVVVEIEVDEITGRASGSGFSTHTKPGRL
jgi:nitroimidazol reductase NimA-like FMN-containing flavoprotein (pyridoxamine 5'-phosphate oxidase superfamily)